MRKIYLLMTIFTTRSARIMGRLTRFPYTHASLGLDEDMNTFYTFRYKGYFIEQAIKYLKPDCPPVPCLLYEYEVDDEVYAEIKALLSLFENQSHCLKYTRLGLVLNLFNIPYKRKRHYFCSHFVADVLKKSRAVKLRKSTSLYFPHRLKEIEGMNLVFQGDMQGYVNNYISKTTIM